MNINAEEDYALRIVLYLAARGGVCRAEDISRGMSVPRAYLVQIARPLRAAGIIDSRYGRRGGYRLGRSADDLTAADVLAAVSGSEAVSAPADPVPAAGGAQDACAARSLAIAAVRAALSSATIRGLLDGRAGGRVCRPVEVFTPDSPWPVMTCSECGRPLCYDESDDDCDYAPHCCCGAKVVVAE